MIQPQVKQNRAFDRVTNLVNPYGKKKKPKGKAKKSTGHRPRSNPLPLVLTIGAINPNKGANTMAKKKKKSSGGKKNHSGKRPSYSVKTLKKMITAKGGKNKPKSYGRNPSLFGQTGPAKIGGTLLAVAGGVTLVKLVAPMFPITWQATDLGRFLTSAGVAVLVSTGAHFVLPAPYRDGVMAGAGAQALSVGLNPIVRKVLPSAPGLMGVRRGLRDFVPATFPEPHNPISTSQRMMIAAARTGSSVSSGGNMGRYVGRWG